MILYFFSLQVNWVVRDWWVFRCNGIAINWRKSFAASPSTALKLLSEITLTEFLPVLFITNFVLFFAFLLLLREKLKPRQLLQLNFLLKVTKFPNTQQHWRYLVEPDMAAAVQSFPDKLEFCEEAEKSAGTKTGSRGFWGPKFTIQLHRVGNGAEFCRDFLWWMIFISSLGLAAFPVGSKAFLGWHLLGSAPGLSVHKQGEKCPKSNTDLPGSEIKSCLMI